MAEKLPIFFFQNGSGGGIAASVGAWGDSIPELKEKYGPKFQTVVDRMAEILKPYGGELIGGAGFYFPRDPQYDGDFTKQARRVADIDSRLKDLAATNPGLQYISGTNGKEVVEGRTVVVNRGMS